MLELLKILPGDGVSWSHNFQDKMFQLTLVDGLLKA